MPIKHSSVTVIPWLRANLGKTCLAGNTGQDQKALLAAVQIVELYSYDPDPSLVQAFRHVVLRMQYKQAFLAYHAIAHVMDWHNRRELWKAAGLEISLCWPHCEFEPKGRK